MRGTWDRREDAVGTTTRVCAKFRRVQGRGPAGPRVRVCGSDAIREAQTERANAPTGGWALAALRKTKFGRPGAAWARWRLAPVSNVGSEQRTHSAPNSVCAPRLKKRSAFYFGGRTDGRTRALKWS